MDKVPTLAHLQIIYNHSEHGRHQACLTVKWHSQRPPPPAKVSPNTRHAGFERRRLNLDVSGRLHVPGRVGAFALITSSFTSLIESALWYPSSLIHHSIHR